MGKLFGKRITDTAASESSAALQHTQGAVITHACPFAMIDIPFLPAETVRPLYDEFVIPFYMKRPCSFGPAEDAAFLRIRDRVTDDIITTLLSDMNWRSRTVAAYFTLILKRPQHLDHIGRLLLRSDVCFAGKAYCLALAHFHTDASVDYLSRYLAYYLTRPDLHFDQADVFAAIRHIDRTQNTDLEKRQSTAIEHMLQVRPDFPTFVHVDRVKLDIEAAARIRQL